MSPHRHDSDTFMRFDGFDMRPLILGVGDERELADPVAFQPDYAGSASLTGCTHET